MENKKEPTFNQTTRKHVDEQMWVPFPNHALMNLCSF